MMNTTRRGFLTFLGMGTYELLRTTSAFGAAFPLVRRRGAAPRFFKPITASSADKLVFPANCVVDIVASFGDPLGTTGPFGPETFGYDNDFTAFFPIDARAESPKIKNEGILWVNHEYVVPLFVSGYTGEGIKTPEQIQKEKLAVGGSFLHVKQYSRKWTVVQGSPVNRRLTALYPTMALTGAAAGLVGQATGTLANCSGGTTPWQTVLSCEENYPLMNDADGLGWGAHESTRIREEEYGWVVEVDPFNELPPVKHTALGRFCHENCAVTIGAGGKLVIYMGDDGEDQCLYKFVSAEKYNPAAPRAERRKLLSEGTLYAAEMVKGVWLPLDLERSPQLKESFKTQGEVLLNARQAAKAVGATPIDRPEDCEVNPADKSLYFTLTSNPKHGETYGRIVRLVEAKDNAESESFQYEVFLAGGPQSGLACPDNLVFDKQGNLWVTCDVPAKRLNNGSAARFHNNGLFVVPTKGPSAGDAFQLASAPIEAELTGPSFTPDWSSLFLSVQHPGELSTNADAATSHWPDGGKARPRPSVVAVRGFRW